MVVHSTSTEAEDEEGFEEEGGAGGSLQSSARGGRDHKASSANAARAWTCRAT